MLVAGARVPAKDLRDLSSAIFRAYARLVFGMHPVDGQRSRLRCEPDAALLSPDEPVPVEREVQCLVEGTRSLPCLPGPECARLDNVVPETQIAGRVPCPDVAAEGLAGP